MMSLRSRKIVEMARNQISEFEEFHDIEANRRNNSSPQDDFSYGNGNVKTTLVSEFSQGDISAGLKSMKSNESSCKNLDSETSSLIFSSDSDDDPTYCPPDSDTDWSPHNVLNIREKYYIEEKGPLEDAYKLKDLHNESDGFHTTELSKSNQNDFDNENLNNLQNEEFTESTIANQRTGLTEKHYQKIVRYPDFCYYCETEINNFARHIQRNHSNELEVQKIEALAPKSLERKRLIAALRKKGNFLKNSECLYKPVHKSALDNSDANYLPCQFCFGMYSRKLLWKHKTNCSQRPDSSSLTTLSDSQNILLPRLNLNTDLKLKVFPRMRADKVSLTAKKDLLICAFAARFLNTHREKHHINVCSRKMRELAKILIESQKLNANIKNLYDLLHPQYFDTVVHSAKIIAKYDPQKDIFLSPTFGMNISRSLKDCCDIAILHLVKRKNNYHNISTAETEANISTFRKLLENSWKYEVSSQAGNDLNAKMWNKTTMVPLATDLKLFRTYLIQKGNGAEIELKRNMNDIKSFNLLMETIFCRLLLLNRKRVGELQRMKLTTYSLLEEKRTESYEEFSEAITPSEKILLKSFKRVVIRGKRGRGVPVLFSKDMQNHMKLLLEARPNFAKNTNVFLFANSKSDEPIVGYKVLQKHANLCGAKNPRALTSTKLRKHLATLTQVFNMSISDIEQLAKFMGHTINVHSQVYRLPDDIFQTAKIAKLLMLMERGDAGKYKGKTLEEIDLNMDEEINLASDSNFNNEDAEPRGSLDTDIYYEKDESTGIDYDRNNEDNFKGNQEMVKSISETKKRELVPWTTQQKHIALEFFRDHIKNKKPPKKNECFTLMEKHPNLYKNKSWTKIKVFIQNSYVKKAKSTGENN